MKREPSNRRKVKKEIETLEGEKEIEREEETEKETQTENGKREEKANDKRKQSINNEKMKRVKETKDTIRIILTCKLIILNSNNKNNNTAEN